MLCDGLAAVLEAASSGACAGRGLTVGILPTTDAATANSYIMLPVAAGLREARNGVLGWR